MTLETVFIGTADWLWKQYGKTVTDSTFGLVKKEWDRFNWAEAATRYAERMREQHDRFKPLGRSEPIALADIFTEVYMLDKITAWQLYNLEELKNQFPDRRSRSRPSDRRHSGLAVARQTQRLYLLGQPGAGKTTFLRYLTLQALTGQLEGVPLFISLHGWSKSGLGLMEFIDREFEICAFPRARPFVEYILQTGRALALGPGPALDWGLTIAWLVGQLFEGLATNKTIQEAQANQFAAYLAGLAELSRALNDPALSAALAGLVPPAAGASPQNWTAFNATLARLMETHRDLRQWELTADQADQLARYFEANRLLLQCLERADVADREAIKRGLLLPESKSTAFEPDGK